MIDIMLLLFAISLDTFIMSLAYGVDGIKIPKISMFVIALCGSISLAVALCFANIIEVWIHPCFATYTSCVILFIVGFASLFQTQLKRFLKKCKQKPFTIRWREISIVIDAYIDEKEADIDSSKNLNIKEAFYLGIAMSLDSIATGLAYGIGTNQFYEIIILSFLTCIFVILIGTKMGKQMSKIGNIELQWISGVVLMLLAFIRFPF